MKMRIIATLVVTASLAAWGQPAVAAVSCSNEVTNDCIRDPVCQLDGTCGGTPVADGTACTPYLEFACATRFSCQTGECVAEAPAPDGTPCQIAGWEKCFSPGACMFGTCVPGDFKYCGDPVDLCTAPVCNPATGACETVSACVAPCQRCEASTGNCLPANVGAACDDFSVCTTNDRCDEFGDCAGIPAGGGEPSPTPSPTPVVTPTPGSSTCVGDCNDDGEVTVNELIKMVNISLDLLPLSECSAGDASGDGEITVNEIVAAVNNSLGSCPAS